MHYFVNEKCNLCGKLALGTTHYINSIDNSKLNDKHEMNIHVTNY